MIFSKKFRKTAASILALVMVFAMSTGAFAYGGTATADGDYYNVSVSYTVEGTLPADAQISIIALEGCGDSTATSDEVKVKFDTSNTATNVLWIDQQAAAATGTFTFQVAKADVEGTGFHVKSGVTGGKTMGSYVEIAAVEPPVQEQSNNANLGSIKINGADVEETIDHTANTVAVTVAEAITANKITAIAEDSKAQTVVTAVEGEADKFTITVTAENGTQKVYTLTVTVNGGTVTPPAGGTEIPKEDITIGGAAVTDPSATITSTTPFGIEDGHVVKVEVEPVVVDNEVQAPTKVVANGGDTTGIQTFYTEYPVYENGVATGETVIKLVTIIRDDSLKASDLTLVDGHPTKLTYGDVNGGTGDGVADALDIGAIIQMSAGNLKATADITRLASDLNGDGVADALDIGAVIQLAAGNLKVPAAAQ